MSIYAKFKYDPTVDIGKVGIVGPDGKQASVIITNGEYGLVVLSPGHISTDNSHSTVLNPSQQFVGEWEEVVNFGVISVIVKASHASAVDGLMVEYSTDGANVDSEDNFTIAANTGKTFSFQTAAKYFRVSYTNGSTLQTFFRLQTIVKPYYVKPSSHRISDNISLEDDAELVKSVLTGLSDIDNEFENVKTYRKALQVDQALVHRIGISEHAKRNLGGSTTLDVEANKGDTLINVTATTGFIVGDLIVINEAPSERSHFHIEAVDPGVSLTLNRPLDCDHPIGTAVQEVQIAMNQLGTLGSPISFKVQPPSNERWQITRVLTTMLDDTSMDDGRFGGLSELPNGTVIRLHVNGEDQTLTHWKTNSDLKDDMYDVTYSSKAPAGQFGLSSRWTFTRAQFVADLDGANGDYLEVLIQDDLTGLLDFELKAQGRLFGG